MLTAVPAFGVLLLSWRRGRPGAPALVPLALATVVVLALFVAADAARPSASESHFGRSLEGGDLVDDVIRKGSRAMASVAHPLALVVVVGAAAVARARPRLGRCPASRATAWALAVVAVIGSVVNDSGLLVGAAVTAVAWPAPLAVGSGEPAELR